MRSTARFVSPTFYAAELDQPTGSAAKRRLQALVSSGDVVTRRMGRDRYGRTFAEVYVNRRRIEQSDIWPHMGRGVRWRGDRHHHFRKLQSTA